MSQQSPSRRGRSPQLLAPPEPPPLVDLSPFLTHASTEPRCAEAAAASVAALVSSAASHGYVHVSNAIPSVVSARLLFAAHTFFHAKSIDASIAPEMRLTPPSYRGYQQLGENVTSARRDMHHALDFMRMLAKPASSEGLMFPHPQVFDTRDLEALAIGENVFPNAELKEAVTEFMQYATTAGQAVMRAVADAMGVSRSLFADGSFSDPFWLARLIQYPPVSDGDVVDAESSLGCGAHTDYGFLTFVLEDQPDATESALQVCPRDDGVFVAAAIPPQDALLLNFGDCLEAVSAGAFPATLHRVVRPSSGRISIAAFIEPNFAWRIRPLLPSPLVGRITSNHDAQVAHQRHVQKMQRFSCYGEYLLSKLSSNFALYDDGGDAKEIDVGD